MNKLVCVIFVLLVLISNIIVPQERNIILVRPIKFWGEALSPKLSIDNEKFIKIKSNSIHVFNYLGDSIEFITIYKRDTLKHKFFLKEKNNYLKLSLVGFFAKPQIIQIEGKDLEKYKKKRRIKKTLKKYNIEEN